MRKLNIVIVLSLSLFFLIPAKILGQKKLNRLVDKISNSGLDFEIAKVGTAKMVDSGTISLPKNLVFVKSVDVSSLSHRKKQKLISTLIPMLNDSTKDWYANVLLYQITGKDATSLIVIENREEWIRRSKETDMQYWNNYRKK